MQEIIKPGGATKKPQDAVLANFVNLAGNLDVTVVLSIIFYVLNEPQMEWISKLVGSQAGDVLCRGAAAQPALL